MISPPNFHLVHSARRILRVHFKLRPWSVLTAQLGSPKNDAILPRHQIRHHSNYVCVLISHQVKEIDKPWPYLGVYCIQPTYSHFQARTNQLPASLGASCNDTPSSKCGRGQAMTWYGGSVVRSGSYAAMRIFDDICCIEWDRYGFIFWDISMRIFNIVYTTLYNQQVASGILNGRYSIFWVYLKLENPQKPPDHMIFPIFFPIKMTQNRVFLMGK